MLSVIPGEIVAIAAAAAVGVWTAAAAEPKVQLPAPVQVEEAPLAHSRYVKLCDKGVDDHGRQICWIKLCGKNRDEPNGREVCFYTRDMRSNERETGDIEDRQEQQRKFQAELQRRAEEARSRQERQKRTPAADPGAR